MLIVGGRRWGIIAGGEGGHSRDRVEAGLDLWSLRGRGRGEDRVAGGDGCPASVAQLVLVSPIWRLWLAGRGRGPGRPRGRAREHWLVAHTGRGSWGGAEINVVTIY